MMAGMSGWVAARWVAREAPSADAVGDDLVAGMEREVVRYCQAESASWVMSGWLGWVAALWP